MTKLQVKARLRKILEKLSEVRDELQELIDEAQDTVDNIEPYEGAYELTPEQEERQEWFEEFITQAEGEESALEDTSSNLEEYTY